MHEHVCMYVRTYVCVYICIHLCDVHARVCMCMCVFPMCCTTSAFRILCFTLSLLSRVLIYDVTNTRMNRLLLNSKKTLVHLHRQLGNNYNYLVINNQILQIM